MDIPPFGITAATGYSSNLLNHDGKSIWLTPKFEEGFPGIPAFIDGSQKIAAITERMIHECDPRDIVQFVNTFVVEVQKDKELESALLRVAGYTDDHREGPLVASTDAIIGLIAFAIHRKQFPPQPPG